jgi:hypothetical protein
MYHSQIINGLIQHSVSLVVINISRRLFSTTQRKPGYMSDDIKVTYNNRLISVQSGSMKWKEAY